MTAHNESHDPPDPPRHVDLHARLNERWSRLEPDEQTIVAMAFTELTARTLTTLQSWERFLDAALALRPALAEGSISPAELHEIAMQHALDHG